MQNDDVRKAEEFLKRRMGLRVTVNSKQIIDEAQAQVCGVVVYCRVMSCHVMYFVCCGS